MNNEELVFAVSENPQPKCQSWFHPIVIENYALRLTLPHLNCSAIFYRFQGDQIPEKVSVPLSYKLPVPLLADHFTIECADSKKEKFYPKLPYASIHYDSLVRQRLADFKSDEQDDDYNILVLGLDSISRLQFQRMLPETYHYLTRNLSAIILKGTFQI